MAIAMQRCKDLRREYQRIFWEVRSHSRVEEAYSAAGELNSSIQEAYEALIQLMPDFNGFKAGDLNDLEKAFEFCETDILAFRCGYWKAEIYNGLKTLKLKPIHSKRIRSLAIAYIQWPGFRREFSQLCRLVILHADEDFVKNLDEMFDASENKTERKKIRALLYRVLNSRYELRSTVSLTKYKLNT